MKINITLLPCDSYWKCCGIPSSGLYKRVLPIRRQISKTITEVRYEKKMAIPSGSLEICLTRTCFFRVIRDLLELTYIEV